MLRVLDHGAKGTEVFPGPTVAFALYQMTCSRPQVVSATSPAGVAGRVRITTD